MQAWLAEQGRGLRIREAIIPIVPGAICFDLLNGGNKAWGRFPPYRDLAYAAACAAGTDFALGSVGAGLGATTANFKGGLGSASAQTDGGVMVAALAVVNAVGSVTVGDGPWFWAAPFEVDGEFGGQRTAAVVHAGHAEGAAQGRSGRDVFGKHHAGRRRHRCHPDEAAGQAAGDDRADRHGARHLSRACADRR